MENVSAYLPAVALCLLLMIGAWYPLLEFARYAHSDQIFELGNAIEFGYDSRGTLGTYANRGKPIQTESDLCMMYNYFSYDIEQDFFYRHIARTRLPDELNS